MASEILKKSNAEWGKRSECDSIGCAITLVANRLAAITALYCRIYDDYEDPHGEYAERTDEDEEDEEEVDEEPIVYYCGNKEKLQEGLDEIADFAKEHRVPFDYDMTLAMIEAISDDNDDVWRNSSIGC